MFNERRYGTGLVLSTVSVLLVASSAMAQDESSKRGGAVGLHVAAAFPAGSLRRTLDTRFGIGGFGTFYLNESATIGLRLEGSKFFLGSEDRTPEFTLPGTIAPVSYEVTTKADLLAFTLGPQFSKRIGPVIPYLTIGAGPSRVSTCEEVKNLHASYFDEPIASSDLAGNWDMAWQVGGGLYIQIDESGGIGLSVHYLDGGHFRYIPPSSVRAGPGGTTTFSMVETDIRYLVVQISLAGWQGI